MCVEVVSIKQFSNFLCIPLCTTLNQLDEEKFWIQNSIHRHTSHFNIWSLELGRSLLHLNHSAFTCPLLLCTSRMNFLHDRRHNCVASVPPRIVPSYVLMQMNKKLLDCVHCWCRRIALLTKIRYIYMPGCLEKILKISCKTWRKG